MKRLWINLVLGALALTTAASAQETRSGGPSCLASDTRSFAERLLDAGFPPAVAAAQAAGGLVEGEFTLEGEASVLDAEVEGMEANPAAANPSAVFTIPGEFLISSWNNMNWQTNFHMGAERTFKKIVFDVDFYVGQFAGRVNDDPTDYGGRDYYCLLWLNSGQSWDNMYGYFNFLWPGSVYGEMQSNVGGYWNPDYGEYGLKIGSGCGGVGTGGSYHFHWEYDAQNGVQWWEVTSGGGRVCGAVGDTGVRSIETSYMFLQLGSQYSPEGPEGATIGWRFADLRVQFIGDTPIGRRPRRR